ncbi:MAG: tetratricopeptide repeat protein [Candidatus Bathyarchaeia archaeon]
MSVKNRDLAKEYTRLGRTYLKRGFWSKAVEMFEKALEITPDDTGIRLRLSYAFLQMGFEERAYSEYRKSLSLMRGTRSLLD